MSMSSPEQQVQLVIGRQVATILANISLGLFGLYFVLVLSDAVPIRLLDPLWLLTVSASLGNAISIPLVGLAFLHLAAFIAPGVKNIESRRIFCSRLAGFAALGFLLLLPLIGYANWRGIRNVNISNRQNLAVITNRAKEITNQIQTATTPLELQARMAKLQGPIIPNSQLSRPLADLKQESLKVVQLLTAGYKNQVKGPSSQEYMPIYKQSLKSMAMALLGAFSFAAGAWNPINNKSLLSNFLTFFAKSPEPNPYLVAIRNKIKAIIQAFKRDANRAEQQSIHKLKKKEADQQASRRKRDIQRNLEAQRKEAAARERKRLQEQGRQDKNRKDR